MRTYHPRSFAVLLVAIFPVLCIASGCDKISSLVEQISPKAKKVETLPPVPSAQGNSPQSVAVVEIPAAPKVAPADAVIRVGDWSLSKAGFNERLEAIKQFIPEFNPKDPEVLKLVVEEIVRQQLLVADAEKRGLAKNRDIEQAVEEFRRTLLVRELAAKIAEDVKVSDEEAEQYYNENKKDFVTPAQWRVREIVVPTEEEAKPLLIELLNGADFAQTAQQRSKTPSAANGGDLGFVEQFEFPQMENAVGALAPGGISSVFNGPGGFYIVKLEEKKGGEQKEFAELKEEIKAGLTMLRQQQKVMEHIDALRAGSDVVVNEKLLQE